ncbi:hypothetical protein Lalb_Chr11g0062761 [Lupinus albus]|uniref:Uncharacterized protein n=1 Tax=Lupinus albus TaxID=3870 RepID=A0A6A4PPQ1_LUPAL|nr:hypothetical protein Lalb_Chr11g0062761 [Lupinus albus]
MKHPSVNSLSLQHGFLIIIMMLVLFCYSSWHVEGLRPLPHQHSLASSPFMMAQTYSGPSRGGKGHNSTS